MFDKKSKDAPVAVTNDPNLLNRICAGTKIVGEITSNSDIRIDGNLKGNLVTQGKLVIGPTGVIDGDIIAANADIYGSINGNLKISELLSLKATADIQGDIHTQKLHIEPGAVFTGSCHMGGNGAARTANANNGKSAKE